MATNDTTQRQSGGIGAFLVNLGVLLMVCVFAALLASFFGWQPPQLLGTANMTVQGTPAAQPTARITQPASAPAQPAPIVIQAPADSAPPVVLPQPAQPAPVEAPRSQVIILHDSDRGAPAVTGSGACQVAQKGTRRCGK